MSFFLRQQAAGVAVIDSFESGSPTDDYSGDTGSASFTTETFAKDGSQALLLDAGGGFGDFIYSTPGDGLSNYFAKGEIARVWVRATNAQRARFLFGLSDADNFYHLEVDFGNNDFDLRKQVGGGNTTLDTNNTSESLSSDTWYEIKVTWDDGTLGGADNDITCDLLKEDGTNLATASANDSTHASESGVGFYTNAGGSDQNDHYFDYARKP